MNIDGEDVVVDSDRTPLAHVPRFEVHGVVWPARCVGRLDDATYEQILVAIASFTRQLLEGGVHPSEICAALLGCGVSLALRFSQDVPQTAIDLKGGVDIIVEEHLAGVRPPV